MTLAEALTELEALKKEHSKATEKQEALQSENKTLHLRNLQLEEIIRHLKGKRFGSSSESLSHEQLLLLQEGLNDKASIPPIKETEVKAHTRKKGGRRPLPQHIERERVIHDLSDEEKVCSCGCGPLTKISEVSSEKLEIIPSKYKIIDHVRYKYACLHCKENVKLASLPPQLLPKTIATPSLIADIVSKKYVDALPLYRQEKIHHRHDLEISRASMAKWLIKVSHLLQPLINLIMGAYAINYDHSKLAHLRVLT